MLPRKFSTNTPLTTTAKRYWQQSINNTKKPGYAKAIKKDKGVSLLVLANCAAGCLILTFAGRKIFYHPDILIGESMRRPEMGVYNETPAREDFADQYRQQTKFFAENLSKAARPIMKTFVDTEETNTNAWGLDFTRRSDETIDIPLEHTSHFNDGLFTAVSPGPLKSAQSNRRDAL